MRQNNPQNRQRSRGRGNQNRNSNQNRNQLNRSMESNGPDVRIRGTAAHIAEKYTQMARDSITSGDTVAAESYWQHAEHYNRLIAVAQAAQAEEQAKRDEERAKRQEEHEKRQEARQKNRSDGDDDGDSDVDGRVRRSRKDPRDDAYAGDEARADVGDRKRKKKANGSDGDGTGKGDGPQPQIEGEPAEVALKDKPISSDDEATKPKKTRTKRKPAPVADDAAELPSFVTGD
ncbi:MAG: DUF4167 domain-containing protein [Rhizobiaceae bacterium]